MPQDNEAENIKKMLAGKPYTHDGLTEFDGLPPMDPHPRTSGKPRMSDKDYQALIDEFERRQNNKK